MSGLNISCGDFLSDDKAGTPFERVLSELAGVTPETKRSILSGFDESEHAHIAPEDAAGLVPALSTYRDRLIGEIGHSDWLTEIAREERTGMCSIKLKWGEGRGWRLYCAVNLLAACERSVAHRQPVVISVG